MKTVADYLQLLEDAMPVNTVSSGAIASKDVPLGAVKKRKVEESEVLDEKMEDIATYRNKVAVQAKIYRNSNTGKYHVKHFLNGSNKHSHDDSHDTEEAAHAAAKRRYPNTTPEFSKMMRESGAYDGENPLADSAGKMPLMGVQAPDMEVSKEKQLSNLKQSSQQNYS